MLPEIPVELTNLIGTIKTCKRGIQHLVRYIAYDSSTKDLLVVHATLNLEPAMQLISKASQSWPDNIWDDRNDILMGDCKLPSDLLGHTFQHFKGNKYLVLCFGRDMRNSNSVVVYKSIEHRYEAPWVRNYNVGFDAWNALIQMGDKTILRFMPVLP